MYWKSVFIFLIGCLVSAVIVKLLLRQQRWGMDPPDEHRKLHPSPVPRTGGLGIFIAMAAVAPLVAWWVPDFLHVWWPVLLCNFLMFTVGFSDDLRPLGAKVKLVGQIGVALVAYSLGLSIDRLSNPFAVGMAWELGVLSLPITLLWLIALPNIVNLVDGMDGLAGGVSLFMCLILAAVGWYGDHNEVVYISLAMAGAILGFLFFNFPPARIFLGDGGAYFLGFFVGTVALASSNKGAILASLLVVMVGFGLPILDTLFAIIRRGIRGLPLFRADVDHIHHRLLQVGYSKQKALWAIYAVCAVLSLIGVSLLWSRGMTLPIAIAALSLLAIFLARHLGYVTTWKGFRQQMNRALSRRNEIQRAILHSQMLELELDHCDKPEEFWGLFVTSARRLGFRFSPEEEGGSVKLLADNHAWKLYYPADLFEENDWLQVAECLRPAYLQGIRKFGDPPPRLWRQNAA